MGAAVDVGRVAFCRDVAISPSLLSFPVSSSTTQPFQSDEKQDATRNEKKESHAHGILTTQVAFGLFLPCVVVIRIIKKKM